jgi:hypothetical protein
VTYVAAEISGCGRYRYTLRRQWADSGPRALWVMCNPSTADATQDDPTIRRCISFSKREGFAGLTVVNLYAWRATDPRELRTAIDPIGCSNDVCIQGELAGASGVIVAWGRSVENARGWQNRAGLVADTLPGAMCLGTTKAGHPRHPLMLPNLTPLVRWEGYP